MRGHELYIKRDGSLTYNYDPADLQPLGDNAPTLRGNAGLGAEYKVGLNVTLSYEVGGQLYNSTLVKKWRTLILPTTLISVLPKVGGVSLDK